jgi:hypothetical protein
MFKVFDILVTVVLFAGFVSLTLLAEACRWMEGQLTEQPPPPPPEAQPGRFYY